MTSVRRRVALRWSDMDAYGHVNNTDVLRLLEEARIGTFEVDRLPGDTGVLVVRHEVEYLAPLVYRAEGVDVDLWVTRVSGATVDVGYEVSTAGADRAATGERTTHVRAASTLVTYDFTRDAPRRLTAVERERFTALEGPPVAFRRRPRESRG